MEDLGGDPGPRADLQDLVAEVRIAENPRHELAPGDAGPPVRPAVPAMDDVHRESCRFSTYFWTLPASVRGSSFTISSRSGVFCFATPCSWQCATTSSRVRSSPPV